MDLDPPGPEPDTDQIDPPRADFPRDSPHVGTFGRVDCIDGVTGRGHGSHLDCDAAAMVEHHEVDLAAGDSDIAIQFDEPVADQPAGSESLARRTYRGAAPAQSLSSVFSSFSTLTSRNVRT